MAVGPAYSADGTTPSIAPRQGRMAEAIVGQAHGKYYEAASRGNVYAGSTSAGRAPQLTFTTAPPFVLYNPTGSQKRASILKVSMAQAATGTLGTGGLFHCGFTLNGPTATQSGVVPSGTAITPKNCDIGSSNNASALLFEAATLNAGPLGMGLLANLSEVAGGTIGGNSNAVIDDVDGAIVLDPTGGWCLSALMAAGSSPLIHAGVVWEEVQIG
jgi:hypothetical protein